MSVYKPAGPAIQAFDYRFCNAGTIANTGGTLYLVAIDLPLGFTVTTTYWISGTTALILGTGPHYWTALFDSLTRASLCQSTDNVAKTIGASALITDTMATPYTTTYAGQYLVGIMCQSGASVAGTQPTMTGFGGLTAIANIASVGGQKWNGSSTASLTTTAPNPAGAITQLGNMPWVGVA